LTPNCNFFGARDIWSACRSVLAVMNSMPSTPGLDHAIDRVIAAAANPDHLDLGVVARFLVKLNPISCSSL